MRQSPGGICRPGVRRTRFVDVDADADADAEAELSEESVSGRAQARTATTAAGGICPSVRRTRTRTRTRSCTAYTVPGTPPCTCHSSNSALVAASASVSSRGAPTVCGLLEAEDFSEESSRGLLEVEDSSGGIIQAVASSKPHTHLHLCAYTIFCGLIIQ